MPPALTLTKKGAVTVSNNAETPHAAFARLWLLPPTTANWVEPAVEVADGSDDVPPSATFADVERRTFLGWNLSRRDAQRCH